MNKDETQLLVKTLHKIAFFSNLSVGETDVILSKFISQTYTRGKTIVLQDRPGKFFAVIAAEKTRVLLLLKDAFKKILEANPNLSDKISHTANKRTFRSKL